MPVGICTSGTYCLLLLSLTKEIFHFKWRLIDNVVGLCTTPASGEGNRSLSSKGTHTVEMRVVQVVTPWKLGW